MKLLGVLIGLTLIAAVGWAAVSAQDSAAQREARGKQIYIQGKSSSGKKILAYLGDSSLEVPATAVPCANCHGLDGHGKPEGGVKPSNITWEALTKNYGVRHEDGRQHPPYTERALELAITRGTDPAGNQLQGVMPRFAMSQEDVADLIAYLKRVGTDHDPGISEDKIIIGTAGPGKGALADLGQALKAVTSAFFDELNSQGGVYNRKIDLRFVETAATPQDTQANFDRLLGQEQVFAMISVLIAGSETEILPLVTEKKVPLIGPLTLFPQTGFPLNREVFYLLSGFEVQARAMVDFAAKSPQFKNKGVAVVYSRSLINSSVIEALKDQTKKAGLTTPTTIDYATGQFDSVSVIRQLRQTNRDLLFLLGNGQEVLAFMKEAASAEWFPSIFLLGSIGGKEIFEVSPQFDGKVFFSFPTSPADQTPEGMKEFRALAAKYKLPPNHQAAQISAYSTAKILVEALKRAGKDLSREKLISALEGLYQYPTGLTPAITYGPNRRIGAMGAYVVTLDLEKKEFQPASGWIDIN